VQGISDLWGAISCEGTWVHASGGRGTGSCWGQYGGARAIHVWEHMGGDQGDCRRWLTHKGVAQGMWMGPWGLSDTGGTCLGGWNAWGLHMYGCRMYAGCLGLLVGSGVMVMASRSCIRGVGAPCGGWGVCVL